MGIGYDWEMSYFKNQAMANKFGNIIQVGSKNKLLDDLRTIHATKNPGSATDYTIGTGNFATYSSYRPDFTGVATYYANKLHEHPKHFLTLADNVCIDRVVFTHDTIDYKTYTYEVMNLGEIPPSWMDVCQIIEYQPTQYLQVVYYNTHVYNTISKSYYSDSVGSNKGIDFKPWTNTNLRTAYPTAPASETNYTKLVLGAIFRNAEIIQRLNDIQPYGDGVTTRLEYLIGTIRTVLTYYSFDVTGYSDSDLFMTVWEAAAQHRWKHDTTDLNNIKNTVYISWNGTYYPYTFTNAGVQSESTWYNENIVMIQQFILNTRNIEYYQSFDDAYSSYPAGAVSKWNSVGQYYSATTGEYASYFRVNFIQYYGWVDLVDDGIIYDYLQPLYTFSPHTHSLCQTQATWIGCLKKFKSALFDNQISNQTNMYLNKYVTLTYPVGTSDYTYFTWAQSAGLLAESVRGDLYVRTPIFSYNANWWEEFWGVKDKVIKTNPAIRFVTTQTVQAFIDNLDTIDKRYIVRHQTGDASTGFTPIYPSDFSFKTMFAQLFYDYSAKHGCMPIRFVYNSGIDAYEVQAHNVGYLIEDIFNKVEPRYFHDVINIITGWDSSEDNIVAIRAAIDAYTAEVQLINSITSVGIDVIVTSLAFIVSGPVGGLLVLGGILLRESGLADEEVFSITIGDTEYSITVGDIYAISTIAYGITDNILDHGFEWLDVGAYALQAINTGVAIAYREDMLELESLNEELVTAYTTEFETLSDEIRELQEQLYGISAPVQADIDYTQPVSPMLVNKKTLNLRSNYKNRDILLNSNEHLEYSNYTGYTSMYNSMYSREARWEPMLY